MEEHDARTPRWVFVAMAVTASLLLVGLVGLGLLGSWLGVGPFAPASEEPPQGATGPTAASSEGYTVWERNDDGTPVGWDPCEPVELVLAEEGWPAGTREDLHAAVDEIAELSGLELVVDGEVDESPSGARLPYQPERYGERWAPVLVGWAEPHEDGLPMRDTDRGVAVPLAVGPVGDRGYVSGQVVLNAERDDLVAGGRDRASSWRAIMMHELAHVLGLGHVEDEDELMYTYPGEGPVAFGPGDRRGLSAVGGDRPCRPAPSPGPVDVAPPPDGPHHRG
jgi:hypothetical protein